MKNNAAHRYLHLGAIIFYEANDSSCLTCRLGMQSEVLWEKCYLKHFSCFAQKKKKKGGWK